MVIKMKCLIFDLDGTLVNSETLCNQAFLNVLPELNASVEELIDMYRGKKLVTILKDIELRIDHQLPSNFEAIYRREVTKLFDRHLQPTTGTAEALSTLDNPKCIASSGPLIKIKHSLSLTGLHTFFGVNTFSSYEIQSWKPEPGLFLHAAEIMGFYPSDCIVIEDSRVGLDAADAAGMQSIHYDPTGSSNSTHAITTMDELPELIKLM